MVVNYRFLSNTFFWQAKKLHEMGMNNDEYFYCTARVSGSYRKIPAVPGKVNNSTLRNIYVVCESSAVFKLYGKLFTLLDECQSSLHDLKFANIHLRNSAAFIYLTTTDWCQKDYHCYIHKHSLCYCRNVCQTKADRIKFGERDVNRSMVYIGPLEIT